MQDGEDDLPHLVGEADQLQGVQEEAAQPAPVALGLQLQLIAEINNVLIHSLHTN